MSNFQFNLGYIVDEEDPRDFLFANVMHEVNLPPVVDYEPLMTSVKNQGNRGACVAFASCAVKEYQESLNRNPQKSEVDLSEEWLYRHIAQPKGGAYIRDAMKVLVKIGVPREDLMPYDYSERDTKAPYVINGNWMREHRRAKGNARQARGQGYLRLHSVEAIMQSLATNGPVILGVPWYGSWGGKGRRRYAGYPIYGLNDANRKVGGHAVCVCGYDRDRELLKIKNSWGKKQFGKAGYAYLDFNALSRWFDCWTIFDIGSPMVKDVFKLQYRLMQLGRAMHIS